MARVVLCSLSLMFCLGVGGAVPAAAALVRTADDVCRADADPCVLDRPVEVAAGSRLDFGRRALVVADHGLLDFGSGDAEVSCARLDVAAASPALRVRGAGSDGRSAGGVVVFVVRGYCSGSPSTGCLVDASCASANAGVCEHGAATATLRASVAGQADSPGRFVLRAAGDVVVDGAIGMSSTRASSEGGGIEIESTNASVRIEAQLGASGGAQAAGGQVELMAALDVLANARIEATGGEFDGGDVTIVAGRDVTLADDVRVEASGGAGSGGGATVEAGRHLQVLDGSAANPVEIAADGHQSADGRGGDGGTVILEAAGELRLSHHARIAASGAPPDGFADLVSLHAGTSLVVDGRVRAAGRGIFGGGGLMVVESDAALVLGPEASFDLTGAATGGDLVIESGAGLRCDAEVDVSGGAGGTAGRVIAIADGNAEIGGKWTTAGTDSAFSRGELFVQGCDVNVTGDWKNAATSGLNRIVARERASVSSTATLSATGQFAANRIDYRSAGRPPVLEASIDPSPAVVLDPSLPACAACDGAGSQAEQGCGQDDLCRAFSCAQHPCDEISPRSLEAVAMSIRAVRDRPAVAARWKVTMSPSLLPAEPERTSLRAVVADAEGRLLLDATLPAGALVEGPGSWRFRAGRDADAAGLRRVDLAIDRRSSMAVWRAKAQGEGFSDVARIDGLALALTFGEPTGMSSCTSTATLYCERRRRTLRCRSAQR